MEGYFTTAEAAAYLGVSTARIRRLALDRRLRSLKLSDRVMWISQASLDGFQRLKGGRRKRQLPLRVQRMAAVCEEMLFRMSLAKTLEKARERRRLEGG